jgi:hypothetical protein
VLSVAVGIGVAAGSAVGDALAAGSAVGDVVAAGSEVAVARSSPDVGGAVASSEGVAAGSDVPSTVAAGLAVVSVAAGAAVGACPVSATPHALSRKTVSAPNRIAMIKAYRLLWYIVLLLDDRGARLA